MSDYAAMVAYCDALKRKLATAADILGHVDMPTPYARELRDEIANLLASDPRNPERLEARARHDSFVALLKSESPQDTITPDASGLFDEESWR